MPRAYAAFCFLNDTRSNKMERIGMMNIVRNVVVDTPPSRPDHYGKIGAFLKYKV
jgi:hypothetical protein